MAVKKFDKTDKMTKTIIFVLLLLIFTGMLGYFVYHQIVEHFAMSDPKLHEIKKHISPLDPELVQSLYFYEGDKSYTINKHKIYLCLKDEYDQYYDFNMLVYVAIHELAHVKCPEIGHTELFYQIFDKLLKQAAHMGIYDPNKPIIKNYCGHT